MTHAAQIGARFKHHEKGSPVGARARVKQPVDRVVEYQGQIQGVALTRLLQLAVGRFLPVPILDSQEPRRGKHIQTLPRRGEFGSVFFQETEVFFRLRGMEIGPCLAEEPVGAAVTGIEILESRR